MHETSWMALHIQRWQSKPQLRYYYEQEIFSRINDFIKAKQTIIEIGSGPGFFKKYLPSVLCLDIEAGPTVNCCADANQLPFANDSIDAFIGVDVLHHFNCPSGFFSSAVKSLKSGGKIVLIEPWAGPIGYFFYRFLHHEDCHRLPKPFGPNFTNRKSAMDGNAMISRQCLIESDMELSTYGLKVVVKSFFGSLSYLMTGGFQPWGAPLWIVRFLVKFESVLPTSLMRIIGIRMVIVLQKI